jgi:hypothetical protein
MIVKVPNRPPYYLDGRTNFGTVTVAMNSVLEVPISGFGDLDLHTPTVSLNNGTATTVSASLVGQSSIKISPTRYSEVTTLTTYVVLSDSFISVNFPLTIVVTNRPPYFTSPTLPFQSI